MCLRLVADFDSDNRQVRTISQHRGEIFIFIKMLCDNFSSFHRCAEAGLRLAADTVSDSREVSADHLNPGEIFIEM